ncbi:MAG: DUF3040 domain-containing protein [Actinomycetota bacterium]|nr:DUF3040 domain-containing protein [Actinomycetota bacterium]
MPLSDREQKILEEIERNLHEEDPRLARNVSGPSSEIHTNRIKLGILIFIIGFAILIGFFASGLVLVGVLAFGVMVGGIAIALSAVGSLATSARAQQDKMGDAFSRWEKRLRERYKRR